MIQLICPVCGNGLVLAEHVYRCCAGHCFDEAKSGYVNLLPPAGTGHHGDDRLMVRARTAFLNKGYYSPLREAAAEMSSRFCPDGGVIIDAGCGEGYYTRNT